MTITGRPKSARVFIPTGPNVMAEGGVDDDGDLCREVRAEDLEEEAGYDAVGVGRQLIMPQAMGVDVAFLDGIAADDWEPEPLAEFLREGCLPGPRPAGFAMGTG